MKVHSKRVVAMFFAMALTFGSMITVSATGVDPVEPNSKVTLVKRKDYMPGYQAVTKDSFASFDLAIKRQEDQFNIYQLAYTKWTQVPVNGGYAWNAEVKWVPEVEEWLTQWVAPSDLSSTVYASPTVLGENEFELVYNAELKKNVTQKRNGDGEGAVIAMLDAMRADKSYKGDVGFLPYLESKGYLVGYKQENNGAESEPGNITDAIPDVSSSDIKIYTIGVRQRKDDGTRLKQFGYTKVASIEAVSDGEAGDKVQIFKNTNGDAFEDTSSISTWWTSGHKILFADSQTADKADEAAKETAKDAGNLYYWYEKGVEVPGVFIDNGQGEYVQYVDHSQQADGTDKVKEMDAGDGDVVAYNLTNVSTGLFFVDARSSTRTYQPVLVDIMPEQVGPNGNWYMPDSSKLAKSLKYEDISVRKWIQNPDPIVLVPQNGQEVNPDVKQVRNPDYVETNYKSAILSEGQFASFSIKGEIPLYTKDPQTSRYLTEHFMGFDEMEQGFNLIASSAELYIIDAEGHYCHPTIGVASNNNGMISISDKMGIYTANLIEQAYTYYPDLNNNNEQDSNEPTLFYSTKLEDKYYAFIVKNGELRGRGQTEESVAAYGELIDALNATRPDGQKYPYTGNQVKRSAITRSLINITFHYNTLMSADTYTNPGTNGKVEEGWKGLPAYFTVGYDALFTSEALVNTDNNINTVSLYYNKDTAGNIGTVSDWVNAYTYGAKIVKMDGDKDINDPGYYLEGARFNLYRLDTTYCGGAEATTSPTTADYENYSFHSDVDGNPSYSAAEEAWTALYTSDVFKAFKYQKTQTDIKNGVDVGSETYKMLVGGEYLNSQVPSIQAQKSDPYNPSSTGFETADRFKNKYTGVYETSLKNWMFPQVNGSMKYVAVPRLIPADDPNCEVDAEHYHLDWYVLMWDEIDSAAVNELYTAAEGLTGAARAAKLDEAKALGEAGVLVTGLGPNRYLLEEQTAPGGFNKLDQFVGFEIERYSAEKAKTATEGYKGFTRDDGQDEVDGVYDIDVLNYKGLQLPSTGGMGTLLFTLIGIAVMSMVIVIILAKRKQQQDISF